MNTAFNLLRYPMQARQRRMRWRWGSAAVGLLAGACMGGVVLQWWREDLVALSAERDRLQAQSLQGQTRLQQDKARREAVALVQRQQGQLNRVQQHQQAWLRLHQAILQGTAHDGWLLERLQVDGERLELQGRIRDVRSLAAAQQRLSDALQGPLTLASLLASPADAPDRRVGEMGHVFVWQGAWPAVAPQSALPASRRMP